MSHNMALTIHIGDDSFIATAEPLSQQAFAPFGDVVANPRPHVHPSAYPAHAASLPAGAQSANQGSAIQYRRASRIRSLYPQAPSRRAEPIASVFVCAARPLSAVAGSHQAAQRLTVRVLERHPFTTQTFSPLASSATRYLVIVAPSLPPSPHDRHLPVPAGPDLPGRGLPDLTALRAFVATSAQAVTYAAGTWHAPMVVLGPPGSTLDFVVTQFASGVATEDCQLVEFESRGSVDPRVEVRIPNVTSTMAKL
ncbi:hypothetical protein CDD82_3433 [Ophiocordyceps australis]|uniref:Ureidoglycolate hydrolase n=1 Tax=Ophiocordyceps australis TaxID=1399860 RepID=A0A2C5ZTH9_9HYPO|nr:hypothetical protein CDD82_3433 [Ophiocordyceps australis]